MEAIVARPHIVIANAVISILEMAETRMGRAERLLYVFPSMSPSTAQHSTSHLNCFEERKKGWKKKEHKGLKEQMGKRKHASFSFHL
ncbi:hypothetical protein POVCU2_0034510 [Plasmodium ovale curtisi]|uniref:Uncharacterized protein n=1 Tax=Plasmodium ovale curtisi TaxID=864141 RepID=A0A1A8WTN7_PLAOA|nr:hypothetical protein POVCU2_0034510 [Plasmodium ovale curtisi]SBS96268.1 hypothetical protein POVCU1_031740 [Plasmodium ovale curtisi]